jgi:hypothetical protein
MGNQVYANGREISCKAAAGKAIAAFPDTCFTPPQTPATPPGVPIPYPNTGMASDASEGSKTVQISGQEIMLKDKSCFKKSSGDEAGSAPKKGMITSKNMGKVYFAAWSMDVKIEGENAVRHLDLMTHNHASMPGNTPTWPYLDEMAKGEGGACEKEHEEERKECGPLEVKSAEKVDVKIDRKTGLISKTTTGGELEIQKTKDAQCANTEQAKKCQHAKKCMLTPKEPERCCPGMTGDHIIETHGFMQEGGRDDDKNLPQFPNYDQNKAPVLCAKGGRIGKGTHGDMHAVRGALELGAMARAPEGMKGLAWTYADARDAAVKSVQATHPDAGCSRKCLEAQLDAYYKQNGMNVADDTPLRTCNPKMGTSAGSQWQRGLELLSRLESSVPRAGGA